MELNFGWSYDDERIKDLLKDGRASLYLGASRQVHQLELSDYAQINGERRTVAEWCRIYNVELGKNE